MVVRVLVVSDLHGDLASARAAVDCYRPALLLCCGDWGDPGEVDEAAFRGLIERVPTYSTFGNHDPLGLLREARNRDGSPVLLGQGEPVLAMGLALASIGGIWAKSHRKPYYVTDADVAEAAARAQKSRPVDILLTHACPVGLADLTSSGRHGGQRCFLDANRTIAPRLHLCGHLHHAQERTLRDGRRVLNVGATPEGSVVVIEFDPDSRALDARLASWKDG